MTTYCMTFATCKCVLLVIGLIYMATLTKWGTLGTVPSLYENVEYSETIQNNTELEFMTHVFRKRREHIADICSAKPGIATKINRRHFLMNITHKLLYCWIHKVASTSWIAAFCKLANKTSTDKYYYKEINYLAAKSKSDLENSSFKAKYFKFLIVRHPFERLVSAYRDRLQDHTHKTYQTRMYLTYVMSQAQENDNMTLSDSWSLLPTFPDFVQWLLLTRPEKFDVHWNRYHDHCAPCSVSYDAIVQLEEQQYIAKVLGIQLQHLQRSSGGETTRSITCQYLKQLSHDQLESLYNIYELDFQMFGYGREIYKNCQRRHYNLV